MSKSLYPAYQQHQAPQPAPVVSEDERMARALQAQYDREAAHATGAFPSQRVVAQPGFVPTDLPFNCGHCGLPHAVRHAANNSVFRCARCGRENEIAIHQNRPVVVLRSRAAWVPVPIFCSIQ